MAQEKSPANYNHFNVKNLFDGGSSLSRILTSNFRNFSMHFVSMSFSVKRPDSFTTVSNSSPVKSSRLKLSRMIFFSSSLQSLFSTYQILKNWSLSFLTRVSVAVLDLLMSKRCNFLDHFSFHHGHVHLDALVEEARAAPGHP